MKLKIVVLEVLFPINYMEPDANCESFLRYLRLTEIIIVSNPEPNKLCTPCKKSVYTSRFCGVHEIGESIKGGSENQRRFPKKWRPNRVRKGNKKGEE